MDGSHGNGLKRPRMLSSQGSLFAREAVFLLTHMGSSNPDLCIQRSGFSINFFLANDL